MADEKGKHEWRRKRRKKRNINKEGKRCIGT